MAEDNKDDKEFDASERKLQKAREEGDSVRSEDIQAAFGNAGFLLALLLLGGWMTHRSGSAGMIFLDRPEAIRLGEGGPRLMQGVLAMAWPWVLLLCGPAVLVLTWLIASKGFVFTPSKVAMKGNRISIIKNFGQKFGPGGLVDFVKKMLRMLAVGLALTLYLQWIADDIFQSLWFSPGQVSILVAEKIIGFLMLVTFLTSVFGGVDWFWQRFRFARRNRMSRKEMTDEMKESEGDPHLKADRRRRAEEIATNQMLADVPTADVILVNPTHYAVALKWDRKKRRAPICVAKGVDEVAAKIREKAQEAGVPIHRDPPTARLLYSTLDIGQEIRSEHYAAVAAAIRFADKMRLKAKQAGWR